MKMIASISDWQAQRAQLKGNSVGFVPTMGALHEGHFSLVKRARAENDVVVVSIFVNPTQFDQKEDLSKYPRTWEADKAGLVRCEADFLFSPQFEDLYPDGYKYRVTENSLSQKFCGQHRPGHFDGVLSVVLKLLNIISPTRAYFGEKDYQQMNLVREMATAFFLPVEILPCPTVRESDGLAMSSRNVRLSESERKLAPEFFKTISSELPLDQMKAKLENLGFAVEYIEEWDGRVIAAVRLGDIRLIDNVPLKGKRMGVL